MRLNNNAIPLDSNNAFSSQLRIISQTYQWTWKRAFVQKLFCQMRCGMNQLPEIWVIIVMHNDNNQATKSLKKHSKMSGMQVEGVSVQPKWEMGEISVKTFFRENINRGSRKLISIFNAPHQKGQTSTLAMTWTFLHLLRIAF